MFDADPKNIQDYNLEFVGKINIYAFENWANTFVEQNAKKLILEDEGGFRKWIKI